MLCISPCLILKTCQLEGVCDFVQRNLFRSDWLTSDAFRSRVSLFQLPQELTPGESDDSWCLLLPLSQELGGIYPGSLESFVTVEVQAGVSNENQQFAFETLPARHILVMSPADGPDEEGGCLRVRIAWILFAA